jgi:hypothetical protein
MDLIVIVRHQSIFRMLIWQEASNAQNSMAAVAAEVSTVWVLIRRLNFSYNHHRPHGVPGGLTPAPLPS